MKNSVFVFVMILYAIPFVYWLQNPDISHMELFLKFWFLYVAVIVLWVILKYTNWFSEKQKGRVPKMKNPPPPPEKKASIKDAYEYLRTRALYLEGVQDCNSNQAWPVWINIDDVYHILSLLEHDQLQDFLKETGGLCYDHGFGCDADDFEMPEFPAERMPQTLTMKNAKKAEAAMKKLKTDFPDFPTSKPSPYGG